jgi:hypothetical protein
LSAGLAALGHVLKSWLPVPEVLLHVLNLTVSFAVITLLFALMYKVLPDATIAWKDVWTGAAVTALLFTVGKFLLGLYLGKADVAAGYGAAGSLVIVLIWVYYSSQILLFGAEFTAVYAERYGVPAENAEPAADPSTKRAGVGKEKDRRSTTARPIGTPRPEEARPTQRSNSVAPDLRDLPSMRGSMGEKLAQFEDQVQVTIQDTKADLLAVVDHVKETADAFIESAEGFVQHTKQTFDPTPQMARHPWMMLSGALVVGYVFGTLPIRHTRNDGPQHVVPGRRLKRLTEVKPSALHPMEAGK